MVPSSWTFLSALPRLPNGKVDRRALPAPETSPASATGGAPRTLVEDLLAEIWGRLLGRERMERDDNFFVLGGHSLLAAQVVSRIRESLGVDLPVRTLFERPTLGAFADAVFGALRTAPAPALPLSPEPREGEIPLSFAQERLWFLDQLDPGKAFYNIPVAVRLGGPLDIPVLRECLSEMVRRQESLRTTFADHGGRPRQVIAAAPSSAAAVTCVDLSGLPEGAREAELTGQLAAEARRPFDLARGPLLRVLLFRLSGDDHLLVPTSHHIISDGWSMTVFLRDLAALYEAGLLGRPSPLAPLRLQYADYAAWQRRVLVGDVLAVHLAYWREQLAGAPGLELPTDRPRPVVETFRGAQHRLRLPGEMVTALSDLSRRQGVTLFMTLLAAFQVLLLRATGQEDLAIGTPVANRGRPELEPLIGLFVNTVVLRTDLGGDPSFRELLARVRGVALGAYAHEDLPFEKLVEEIQPERDTSRNPLFQVMCVLQNQPWPELRMGGLTLTPLEVDSGTAKLDLTVSWREQE
jgi:aryl carrier-like protein